MSYAVVSVEAVQAACEKFIKDHIEAHVQARDCHIKSILDRGKRRWYEFLMDSKRADTLEQAIEIMNCENGFFFSYDVKGYDAKRLVNPILALCEAAEVAYLHLDHKHANILKGYLK